jgi:hypothetical protein
MRKTTMSWKYHKLIEVQAQQEEMSSRWMGITHIKVVSMCSFGKNEQK